MKPKAYSYIRFSTKEQAKGHSFERQLEQANRYCQKHDLQLDHTLNMYDLGRSGRKKGRQVGLQRFLDAIDQGRVPAGSYLLVESLDRLSRQDVDDAYDQFRAIIKAGIRIVTLMDSMEYSRETIKENWVQLIISIVYMARAWDESERKSQRAAAQWAKARNEARQNGKLLSVQCPNWLRPNDNPENLPQDDPHSRFDIIPEAVEAIRQVFKFRVRGEGADRIARRMNELKIWMPPLRKNNKTGQWNKNYINRILSDQAVLGHNLPHVIEKVTDEDGNVKERSAPHPDGYIFNYYPAIIDDTTWQKVQTIRETNARLHGRGGGAAGREYNVFRGLLRCGLCGGPVHYEGKGRYASGPNKGKERNPLVRCAKARYTPDCSAGGVNYKELLQVFFEQMDEISIDQILPNAKEKLDKIQELRTELRQTERDLNLIDDRLNNLKRLAGRATDDASQSTVADWLSEALAEKQDLTTKHESLDERLKSLQVEADNLKRSKQTASRIYERLSRMPEGEQKITLRRQIRNELLYLFEWIELYPRNGRFKDVEEYEPGRLRVMLAKRIDRITVKWRGVDQRTNLRFTFEHGVDDYS